MGRLGKLLMEPGFYIYVGSAFGPGGLKARLNHHLKPAVNAHWHIDYLRPYARVIEIWYTTDPIRRELDWVTRLTRLRSMAAVHPGFGASDSNCVSHLFSAMEKPGFERFVEIINTIPDHADVFMSKMT